MTWPRLTGSRSLFSRSLFSSSSVRGVTASVSGPLQLPRLLPLRYQSHGMTPTPRGSPRPSQSRRRWLLLICGALSLVVGWALVPAGSASAIPNVSQRPPALSASVPMVDGWDTWQPCQDNVSTLTIEEWASCSTAHDLSALRVTVSVSCLVGLLLLGAMVGLMSWPR